MLALRHRVGISIPITFPPPARRSTPRFIASLPSCADPPQRGTAFTLYSSRHTRAQDTPPLTAHRAVGGSAAPQIGRRVAGKIGSGVGYSPAPPATPCVPRASLPPPRSRVRFAHITRSTTLAHKPAPRFLDTRRHRAADRRLRISVPPARPVHAPAGRRLAVCCLSALHTARSQCAPSAHSPHDTAVRRCIALWTSERTRQASGVATCVLHMLPTSAINASGSPVTRLRRLARRHLYRRAIDFVRSPHTLRPVCRPPPYPPSISCRHPLRGPAKSKRQSPGGASVTRAPGRALWGVLQAPRGSERGLESLSRQFCRVVAARTAGCVAGRRVITHHLECGIFASTSNGWLRSAPIASTGGGSITRRHFVPYRQCLDLLLAT